MLRMSFSPALLPLLLLVFIQIAVPAVVIIVEKKPGAVVVVVLSTSGNEATNEREGGNRDGSAWKVIVNVFPLSLRGRRRRKIPFTFPVLFPCRLCKGTLLFSSLASLCSVLFSRP